MRTFVIGVAAAVFFLCVILAQQAGEIRQLKTEVARTDDRYHHLNQRMLMLEHPELVRPFSRSVWESARR